METTPTVAFASHAGDGKILMRGVRLRVSATETGGAFELMEFDGAPSPPPHVHHAREELFFVVEGTAEFVLGDEVIDARAGSMVFIPRGAVHGFNAGPGARMLAFVTPAGLEGFFEMLGNALASGKTPKEIGEMSRGTYDIVPVGTRPATLIEEAAMSSIAEESVPITIDIPVYQARTVAVGDLTLAFETIKVDHDATPMFKGLPDDRCPCPHWGVMTEGSLTLNYRDGDKVYKAGDVFYMPPGHIPTAAAPGTRFITFSPTSELQRVWAVVAKNAESLASKHSG